MSNTAVAVKVDTAAVGCDTAAPLTVAQLCGSVVSATAAALPPLVARPSQFLHQQPNPIIALQNNPNHSIDMKNVQFGSDKVL